MMASNQEAFQALLQQKAMIEAQIAQFTSISPLTASQPLRQQGPERMKARTYSHGGSSMTRVVSSKRDQYEAVPMSGKFSHHSAPTMARSSSRGSSLQFPSWGTSYNDPISTYNLQQQHSLERSISQQTTDPQHIVEIGWGELPEEYFARENAMPILSVTPSPVDGPTVGPWQSPNAHHRGSISSQRRQSFGIPIPTTPSTTAMTFGTTLASDMSRGNSLDNAFLGPFEMMTVNSNTSFYAESNLMDERSLPSRVSLSTSSNSKLSSDEQNFLVSEAGGMMLSYPDQSAPDQVALSTLHFEGMERSESNGSSSSTSSGKARAVGALKRQVRSGATQKLAPKAGEVAALSREGSHTMVPVNPIDGAEDTIAKAISKARYQRPQHDKVYCTECADHPGGFRGAHELHRHKERQHSRKVKKFFCTEPADGISDLFRPTHPLSKCKSCAGQKHYNAYYNVAAHLRRAHFAPKGNGCGRSKAGTKVEKRGGKGGGDWPPMNELRRWMGEVEVRVSEHEQEGAEEEDAVEDCTDGLIMDAHLMNGSLNDTTFDSAFAYADATTTNDNTLSSEFTTQSMQDMQFNSFHLGESHHSSFLSMNGASAPIDHFTQHFDQSYGLDFFPSTFDV